MAGIRNLFYGKNITVMGLGLLGRGLNDTLFLVKCGAHVTVTDLKSPEQLKPSLEKLKGLPVELKLGGHDAEDFVNADMILRNADVPKTSRFLEMARQNGVPVEMDESLFCKNFKGTVVGITGTRGKTTTSTLVWKMLCRSGRKAFLSGNIVGQASLPLLDEVAPDDIVVLELSSWQLQGFHDAGLSPHASVFTNVYPDHLNRYSGMEEYINDKKAVFLYQSAEDFCIFNGDQPEGAELASQAPGSKGFFRASDVPSEWRVKLPGRHNLQNLAAAIAVSRRLGVRDGILRETAETFDGVEHRLQWLGERNGIGFINDSTSTTPVAGCAALESIVDKRILLIAGGADKNLDLSPFAATAAEKAYRIALLEGKATNALTEGIIAAGGEAKIVGTFGSLEDAVAELWSSASSGDVILLSPGCASFGMFQNEYHRGETFIRIVERIPASG